MRAQSWAAIRVLVVLTIITGVLYPLAMLGLGQTLWSDKANGSGVQVNGTVVGSDVLGQQFTSTRYFHPRPSAAGEGYDATASGGSNLGPTNPKLLQTVNAAADAYRKENGLPKTTMVPVDAVTSSGSGLDPDISPTNAYLQASRVARARNLPVARVRKLVRSHISPRAFGIFGEEAVNVLNLNLDLDSLKS